MEFTTTGVDQDTDGYMVSIDTGPARAVASNGSITFNAIPPGVRHLVITGVAVTCDVDGGFRRRSDASFVEPVVALNETTVLEIAMVCTAKPIAFASDRSNGNMEVHRMNVNGSGATSLGVTGTQPRWSPDGSRIAFRTFATEDYTIYVMNADGTDAVVVATFGANVTWSPDGTRLAFERLENNMTTIYAVDVDGNNLEQLTNFVSGYPDWGPDGRIAFSAFNDIHVMNADGSNVIMITEDGRSPAWSPDGSTIAFNSNRDLDNAIFLVNSDGTNVRRRTARGSEEKAPRWSPDGAILVFEVYAEGPADIGIGSSVWSGAKIVSPDPAVDLAPDWR